MQIQHTSSPVIVNWGEHPAGPSTLTSAPSQNRLFSTASSHAVAQGSTKVARAGSGTTMDEMIFDGVNEVSLPLECIADNPDSFASVLAETGRSLMLKPGCTHHSRFAPDDDSFVDSSSRKIFIHTRRR